MTEQNLYLAIDQGGGSSRAIVFDDHSNFIAKASQSIGVEYPRLGWVEQDAEEIVASIDAVLKEVARQLGSDISKVAAAGLATQRSNVVCWRKSSGEPLSAAISWQDRRAYKWMEQFRPNQKNIRQRTGLVVSPHYGVSKIKWCLENISEVIEAEQKQDLICGPLASYLVSRLTSSSQALVDPANASRTLLWNIEQGQWDPQLLELFGLGSDYLPTCVDTFSDFGEIEFAGHTIPLNVVTGDQSAALFAGGKPEENVAHINMGTGVFIQYPTGKTLVDIPGLLCSLVYRDEKRSEFVIESTINGASNALVEVENVLGINEKQAETKLCQWFEQYSDPPLFLNGVAGLAAPYWIPEFKSKFVGDGTAEEKIIAVAESILFLVKVNIDLMLAYSQPIKEVKLTGGLSNSDCLCQKLANLLQLTVNRAPQTEATAMGLAFLTASSPKVWSVPEGGQCFTAQQDDLLHNRYRQWLVEMEKAIQKYRAE